jgi:hypothetical protein
MDLGNLRSEKRCRHFLCNATQDFPKEQVNAQNNESKEAKTKKGNHI